MEVKVKGLNEALATFGKTKDQLAYAVSLALNKTARSVKKAEQDEMVRVFDQPTPFTMNSLQIIPSDREKLEARIRVKGSARLGEKHYILREIKGAGRTLKAFEQKMNQEGFLPNGMYTVPGKGARIDGYGNMSRAQLNEILDALRIEAGFGVMAKGMRTFRKKNSAPREYVLIRDPGGMPKGVYRKMSGDKFPMPVLIFVRQPKYRPRFNFQRVGKAAAQEEFKKNMIDAIGQAIRSAK